MRVNVVCVGFALERVVSICCAHVAAIFDEHPKPHQSIEKPLKYEEALKLLPPVNCLMVS